MAQKEDGDKEYISNIILRKVHKNFIPKNILRNKAKILFERSFWSLTGLYVADLKNGNFNHLVFMVRMLVQNIAYLLYPFGRSFF